MSNKVLNIEKWKRKDKFDFFVKMANPIVSVTVKVNVDNCYTAAKRDNQSFFILYSWAIIKAVNDIEELRVRAVRRDEDIEIISYDKVDLVTPIAVGNEDDFVEVTIPYNADFKEFYASAKQIIALASSSNKTMTEHNADSTCAVVSAMPFLDFTSVTTTVSELGGLNQIPLIAVGAMCESDGVKSMPIAISFHHGLVDGYHFGQFYKYVQQNLDRF